jgi:PAS domain S-box-containing protein
MRHAERKRGLLSASADDLHSPFLDLEPQRRADLFFHAWNEAPDALIIVSTTGLILYANKQAESIFGYHQEELVDRPVEVLLPAHVRDQHVGDRQEYVENRPVSRPMGRGIPLYGRRKSGAEFPAEISLSPVSYGDEAFVIAAVRDASQWVRVETLQERLHRPLSRIVGLREARSEIDRSVDAALDDLVEDLLGEHVERHSEDPSP